MFNIENIQLIITIGTVVFAVYLYFRKPQINSEIKESEFTSRLNTFREELINLRDNHVHSLEIKIDTANTNIAKVSNEITKLSTIIEERIPKK